MVTHPIRIARNSYRGRDLRKQRKAAEDNQIATDLEMKINAMLLKQERPVQSYFCSEIARITRYDYDTVARLGYSIDGGNGGFTAWRHDMTCAEALAAFDDGRGKGEF
jgi:hypothetical protein